MQIIVYWHASLWPATIQNDPDVIYVPFLMARLKYAKVLSQINSRPSHFFEAIWQNLESLLSVCNVFLQKGDHMHQYAPFAWEEVDTGQGGLKCTSVAAGVQSAMIPGQSQMPGWSVVSWATVVRFELAHRPITGEELVLSWWMMSVAMATRVESSTADTPRPTTVDIARTPESTAVSLCICSVTS